MSVDRVLSWAGLSLALSLAAIPAVFAAGPAIENRFFPVVGGVVVSDITNAPDGLSFYVEFNKLRSCEFLGIAWYHDRIRVGVAFEPGAENYPATRPEGEQFAGPWMLEGVDKIDGTRAVVYHRCHPLWVTVSHFYP